MKKIGTRQYSFTGGGFLGPLKEFASLPLLMVRDGDGKIRVFFNLCSPSGLELVEKPRRSNGIITCR